MLVLPSKIYPIWEEFLVENKILVYKYMVREVKKGLDGPKPIVELFKFEDNSMKAWIPEEEYINFLLSAKEVFVDAEEYEYAAKIVKLLDMYHINRLIEESK